jgi:hypothetical protein
MARDHHHLARARRFRIAQAQFDQGTPAMESAACWGNIGKAAAISGGDDEGVHAGLSVDSEKRKMRGCYTLALPLLSAWCFVQSAVHGGAAGRDI